MSEPGRIDQLACRAIERWFKLEPGSVIHLRSDFEDDYSDLTPGAGWQIIAERADDSVFLPMVPLEGIIASMQSIALGEDTE